MSVDSGFDERASVAGLESKCSRRDFKAGFFGGILLKCIVRGFNGGLGS